MTGAAIAVFLTLGVALGWRIRRAAGAHEDVAVNLARVRNARKARAKHGFASLILAGLILLLIAGLIQGS